MRFVVGEAKGLLPVLVASHMAEAAPCSEHGSTRGFNVGSVRVWPLPLHVSARAFPVLLIGAAWLAHGEAQLDVAVAYVAAACAPRFFHWDDVGSAASTLTAKVSSVEHSTIGWRVLEVLRASDAFVCPPPSTSPASTATLELHRAVPDNDDLAAPASKVSAASGAAAV
eukprot:TRINITY_DN15574_c0_g1_i2.p1 TRINITY_DN15574_c0_g1~~TRINITY_DN15574_c0_g1_i2.p1  ORF type:complete len:169 (+),score=41.58 TRINITY_DN15574_c0_g1_i2:288-794(+)